MDNWVRGKEEEWKRGKAEAKEEAEAKAKTKAEAKAEYKVKELSLKFSVNVAWALIDFYLGNGRISTNYVTCFYEILFRRLDAFPRNTRWITRDLGRISTNYVTYFYEIHLSVILLVRSQAKVRGLSKVACPESFNTSTGDQRTTPFTSRTNNSKCWRFSILN